MMLDDELLAKKWNIWQSEGVNGVIYGKLSRP